jgi:hypothetical protein
MVRMMLPGSSRSTPAPIPARLEIDLDQRACRNFRNLEINSRATDEQIQFLVALPFSAIAIATAL